MERARQSVGLPPFEYGVQLPAFEQDTTIGTVARGVGSALFRTMLAYGPGTRVGLDPEHLHKMRVSTRRLRTALRVFRRAFDRDDRKALQAELRWLGGILGEVRDLDVHLLALPQWIARFGPDPVEGWASLEDALTRHHTEARARLLQALDDPRYAALARRADALFGGDDPTDEAKQPAGKAGRRILAARVDRFREAVERFRRTHAAEDAHRLRIVGKRLRYTARFLQPLLDDRTQQGLRSLAAFQDRLGAIQDVVAAGDLAHRLRDEAMTADQPDAAYLYVLGQLGGAAAMSVALIRPVVDRALDDLEAEISLEQLGA